MDSARNLFLLAITAVAGFNGTSATHHRPGRLDRAVERLVFALPGWTALQMVPLPTGFIASVFARIGSLAANSCVEDSPAVIVLPVTSVVEHRHLPVA